MHRKFRRLVSLLKMNQAHVLGHLEMIYLSAHVAADPTFADGPTLEAAACWDGKEGQLVQALRTCGLVDKMRGHALTLHDYWDHAPDYVQKRAARRAAPNGAERRHSAPDGSQRTPTDPIPIPDRPDLHMQNRSSDPVRKDRDRPGNVIPMAEGKAPKRGQGGPQAVAELLNGLGMTPEPARKAQRVTKDGLDLGTATANELAIWASRWEKNHDTTTARKLWKSRLAALAEAPGGLEFFRKLCSTLRHNRAQVPDGRKDRIQSPSRYLNAESLKWLKQHAQEAS